MTPSKKLPLIAATNIASKKLQIDALTREAHTDFAKILFTLLRQSYLAELDQYVDLIKQQIDEQFTEHKK